MIGYISLLDGRTVAIVMPSAPAADAAPDTLAEPCPTTLRSPRSVPGLAHSIDRFRVAKPSCRPTGALCAIGKTLAAFVVAASILGGFAGERSALAKPTHAQVLPALADYTVHVEAITDHQGHELVCVGIRLGAKDVFHADVAAKDVNKTIAKAFRVIFASAS